MTPKEEDFLRLKKENKAMKKEISKLQAENSRKDDQLKEKDLHIDFLTDRLAKWADKFFDLRTGFINLPMSARIKKAEEMGISLSEKTQS
jgi:predicted nuclease with TOPRIM domain